MNAFENTINIISKAKYQKAIECLNINQLHDTVSSAVMEKIADTWQNSSFAHENKRRAYYFSAEYLVGRAIYNNLFCSGLLKETKDILSAVGRDISDFEEIEDAALGNGGLGRLAACYLDSAATCGLPLDGYGIRYRFGLFKQKINNGFQEELIDFWGKHGDPWSVRKDEESVIVSFADGNVKAVPYDMPIIGYGAKHISTLRLWQSEAISEFDFALFNEQKYDESVKEKNYAEDISRVLYPNDSKTSGKILRLKQQYFFTSASLQDIIRKYKSVHNNTLVDFEKNIVIQLNDTHPVISIPELIRLLMKDGKSFEDSFEAAKKIFRYTNHTIMQEALEKWDIKIIKNVSSEIAEIIKRISGLFDSELKKRAVSADKYPQLKIIRNNTVNMAYLACYCSEKINGVARLHTEILKTDVLKEWYEIYPEKFVNVTNGITQRRWLGLCNEELSDFITEHLESSDWLTDLLKLNRLKSFVNDKAAIDQFMQIKKNNKIKLADYVAKNDCKTLDPNTVIDVQVKRLHEYKRQLLNILCILELYFEIKEGSLTNFTPTTFVFAAKSAPGYYRAKAIIKLINEVSSFIARDADVSQYIKVLFLSNYNVSYAEKIVAAADVSEQISTAGTEASGTGNMKLMLNGAVTLGTYDGANIEIVNEAGEENNYIFGAKVEDIEKIADSYDPRKLYENDSRIKRCLDMLVNGELSDDNSGMFRELYNSILDATSWHRADHYYLLLDFEPYLKARLQVNNDYKDRFEFSKKCFINMCSAGIFSSDRSIKEYAEKIWQIS